jgi:hypothetical protein
MDGYADAGELAGFGRAADERTTDEIATAVRSY